MELAPKHTGLSTARLERITEHMELNYIAPGKIAGAQIAVARHGHLAYFRSFGQMDLERGKRMSDGGAASTIFWVDPAEDLSVVFMTQLIPSTTFNFRGQLKSIIYSSIVE